MGPAKKLFVGRSLMTVLRSKSTFVLALLGGFLWISPIYGRIEDASIVNDNRDIFYVSTGFGCEHDSAHRTRVALLADFEQRRKTLTGSIIALIFFSCFVPPARLWPLATEPYSCVSGSDLMAA